MAVSGGFQVAEQFGIQSQSGQRICLFMSLSGSLKRFFRTGKIPAQDFQKAKLVIYFRPTADGIYTVV